MVDRYFTMGITGLRLVPLDQTPRALPGDRNWSFYEISRDNEAWKEVHLSQTLAMRLQMKLIVNHNELQGQHQIIVFYRGKRVELEFALFAVHIVQ
jgi:predicted component of type VI protein secretion system